MTMMLPITLPDKSETETNEAYPPVIDLTDDSEEENGEGDSVEVDSREGTGGEGNSGWWRRQ